MKCGDGGLLLRQCMEFDKKLDDPSAVASCYNPNPLSTSFLSQDPAEARNCQAFRLHNEGGWQCLPASMVVLLPLLTN